MYNGNWNGNGWPLSKKKLVRLMLGLTIVVWATQTLLSQWGFGNNEPAANDTVASLEEKFVPGTARFASGATLELRSEATVVGAEVKLKQVCRWSDSDAAIFAPIADLTLTRLGSKVPFRGIQIGDLKQTLRDAGVNIAAINFVGATSCTVGRSDVEFNEGDALQKWIDAHEGKVGPATEVGDETPTAEATASGTGSARLAAASGPRDAASTVSAAVPLPAPATQGASQTLRSLLVMDIAQRLNLREEQMQMSFRPQDERVLNLPQDHFNFQIDPKRAKNLGDVSWSVTIASRSGGEPNREGDGATRGASPAARTVEISATARAWQSQVVVSKPMPARQLITEDSVVVRRALIERIGDDEVLTREQAIGQQAARELKPGTILTGRMVDAVQLVRSGQFVTVVLQQGGVEIKSVARAMEGGSLGQTIRVKNEATRDVFSVILTGPQTASMSAPNIAAAR